MDHITITSKNVLVRDQYHDDFFGKEILIKKFRFFDLFRDFRIFNGVHISTIFLLTNPPDSSLMAEFGRNHIFKFPVRSLLSESGALFFKIFHILSLVSSFE